MKIIVATFFLVVLCAGQAFAQPAPVPIRLAVGPPPLPKLNSPEVLPDRRVTFRLRAPDALKVAVQGAWLPFTDTPMTKGDDGIWTLTTPPLQPGLWSYNFLVDGVKATDPSTQNVSYDEPGVHSTVLVTGGAPSYIQPRVVPHGTVQAVWLQSTTLHTAHRMMVYTPPGYEDSKERYPVLYLYHGSAGNEEDWIQMGLTNVIMDNLIAEGKAKAMIVVMPNGYPDQLAGIDWGGVPKAPLPVGTVLQPHAPPARQDYAKNEADIVGSIVPSVDARFRTIAKPSGRALAGLSMGAGISIAVGFKHPDVFSYVGEFSSGNFASYPITPINAISEVASNFLADVNATNKNFKLIFFAVGIDDPRHDSTTKVTQELQERNFHLVYKDYPGIHDWPVWRAALVDFAELLFK